ncbi:MULTISPECIES: hypothetical protein [Shewanella]|uniref:hypothetical protein n=1 Tax=Shewanella TaxID=22 RepID=UPI000DFBB203|nr:MULTISPECIES: hypothetical protein [Shewanella]MCU8004139.1 hypothetical protein [Shewanella sp. SM96]SUI78391.1 Uncharacterised protein [Shewanella baltica]
MGRKRQDRTIEEWTFYGENLLNIIGKKHKSYKNIETTISKLISEPKNTTKQELTNTLNLHKDNLGKHWLAWTKKIKQKSKDENRSKFYIENNTYNKILRFIELTKETKKQRNISDNEVFNRIFKLLYSFGVHNESEMKSILNQLDKFNSSTSERNSKDKLTNKDDGYQGQTSKIIHAILKELDDRKISSFGKLQSIKKNVRNEKIDELKSEIESLKNKIKKLESKLGYDEIELDLEFDK